MADRSRTTYLFDVRTPEEFAEGTLPGATHAPGGQLMQATDAWVGVRNARLIVFDDDGVRAIPVASWLRQMGHDAHVLKEGVGAAIKANVPVTEGDLPELPAADVSLLSKARIVDLRSSAEYRKAHLLGADWSIRPRIADAVKGAKGPVALVAADARIAALAALDLAELGVKDVSFLPASRMEGLTLESTPDSPPDAERIDFLFHTHKRHDGDRASAMEYLRWETALIGQLDPSERARFRIQA
jgi:rhodanese-related sulfurtransferase